MGAFFSKCKGADNFLNLFIQNSIIKEKNMSCFSCCEEDDTHKASDNGPFVAHNSAGNSVPYL